VVCVANSRFAFAVCRGFLPDVSSPRLDAVPRRLLPASYVFEAMRAVLAGQAASKMALLAGGALAVVYVLLACWFFTRVFRYAVQTGLIARYSAETVS